MYRYLVLSLVFMNSLCYTLTSIICKPDQIKLIGANTTCVSCQVCEIGFGLSVECGRNFPSGTNIDDCLPCVPGKNYSTKRDYGQCKPCKLCGEHRNKTGSCDGESDKTKCGDCLYGYYGNRHHRDCLLCATCCGDNKDEKVKACEYMPKEKQCAYRGEKCPANADPRTKKKKNTLTGGKIAAIVIGIVLAIILVGLFIWYRKTTPKQRNRCWRALRQKKSRNPSADTQHHHVAFNNAVNKRGAANPAGRRNSDPDAISRIPDGTESRRSSFGRSVSHPGATPQKTDRNSNFIFSISRSLANMKDHFIADLKYKKFKNEPSTETSTTDGGSPVASSPQHHAPPQTLKGQTTVMVHQPPPSHHQGIQNGFIPRSRTQPNGSTPSQAMDTRATTSNGTTVGINGNTTSNGYVVALTPSLYRKQRPLVVQSKEEVDNIMRDIAPHIQDSLIEDLPYEVTCAICNSLNSKKDMDFTDCRMLGEYAGLDKGFTNRVMQLENPTKNVLERLYQKSYTVKQLIYALISNGFERFDIVPLLLCWCLEQSKSNGNTNQSR